MTPKAQQALGDPQFYQLPPDEQQKALAMVDKDFAGLPMQERAKVIQMGQQKLGSAPTPPSTGTVPPMSQNPEGFWHALGATFGATPEQGAAQRNDLLQHPVRSAIEAALGPAYSIGKGAVQGIGRSAGELEKGGEGLMDAPPGQFNWNALGYHAMQAIPFVGAGLERGSEQLNPKGNLTKASVGTALGTAAQAAPMLLGGVDTAFPGRPTLPPIASTALRIGMQDLGGAGKEPVAKAIREDAVRATDAQKGYTDALRAAQDKNTTAKTEYVNKEFAARQSEAQQAAATAQKQVIERGQQAYVTRAIDNARQTFKNVKAGLDTRFNALRDRIGTKPIKSDAVKQSIENAKDKFLMGAPESLTKFNDLMRTMTGTTGPELTLADQTAQNMGYKDFRTAITNPAIRSTLSRALPPDVWKAAIDQRTRPLSWQEGRVHYTALGDKLYAGGIDALPGNVRQAIGVVRDALDKELGAVAEANKLGKFYRSAQDDWAQFKKDWDDMSNLSYAKSAMGEAGSPLARLVRAADPKTAARALSNDRIMDQLARYRPQGLNLNLAKGFRALDARLDGIDKVDQIKHPAKPKYESPPAPPDTSSISPAQIRYEKLETYAGRPWRWYDLVPFNLFERTLLKSNDIRRWVAEQPRQEIPVERQITK